MTTDQQQTSSTDNTDQPTGEPDPNDVHEAVTMATFRLPLRLADWTPDDVRFACRVIGELGARVDAARAMQRGEHPRAVRHG